jgi:hypothetical protein
MVRKIVLALAVVALTATASTAFACGKGQMLLRIDNGTTVGGTTCASFSTFSDAWWNWGYWF